MKTTKIILFPLKKGIDSVGGIGKYEIDM
jgi:hypothetical protein